MSNASRALSWISRLRTEPARESTDWADLGTAYGLDQSMQSPAAEAPPGKAPEAPERGRGWPRRKPRAAKP